MPRKSCKWFGNILCSSLIQLPPSLTVRPPPFLLSAKPVTLMSCVQSSQGPLGFHQGLCPSWYSSAFDVVPTLTPCGQTLDLVRYILILPLQCNYATHINLCWNWRRWEALWGFWHWRAFVLFLSKKGIAIQSWPSCMTTFVGRLLAV